MSNKDFSDSRKENRASAKDKVDQVVKALGLTKDERRKLHDALGEDYIEYQDILTLAKSMFNK
jgi:hypothetical protein